MPQSLLQPTAVATAPVVCAQGSCIRRTDCTVEASERFKGYITSTCTKILQTLVKKAQCQQNNVRSVDCATTTHVFCRQSPRRTPSKNLEQLRTAYSPAAWELRAALRCLEQLRTTSRRSSNHEDLRSVSRGASRGAPRGASRVHSGGAPRRGFEKELRGRGASRGAPKSFERVSRNPVLPRIDRMASGYCRRTSNSFGELRALWDITEELVVVSTDVEGLRRARMSLDELREPRAALSSFE